ncbi:hypothetical protein QAD02_001582, partial [Eretmocerus hayati]
TRLILLLVIYNLVGSVFAVPDSTSTAYPSDLTFSFDNERGLLLMSKWKKRLTNLKTGVKLLVEQLTNAAPEPIATKLRRFSKKRDHQSERKNSALISGETDSNSLEHNIPVCEPGPSNAQSPEKNKPVEEVKYKKEEEVIDTNTPGPDTVLSSLTPEEMQILEGLQEKNHQIREFEEQMKLEWTRTHSPEPLRPWQGLYVPRRTAVADQPAFQNGNLRLERQRMNLLWELERLRFDTEFYRDVRMDEFGAGPCNHRGE